uniref:Lamin-B2-like n=1 Tax=Phallusia mammillata TaxID=59560 RepID=A0A6F9DKF1_9ASCI|nr:lamin-B2-like [Phallusia mammillata]
MSGENKADGDNPLVTGRLEEKSDLQNLNHRFSAYIQNVRSWRLKQQDSSKPDDSHWTEQINSIRSMYENQLAELRSQLECANRDKNEIEASRAKYDSMSTELESRLLSLNETVLSQKDTMTRLQVQLSNKELELQQAQSNLTAPRTELESCRLERDDYKKRLVEAERRCLSEEKGKSEFQHQLSDLHSRCSHEILLYQQEVNDLHERLEKSRHLVLEMEEAARRSGQQSGDVALMMRNAREASEAELRRYMEEAEAKHNLSISELKMRMEADTRNLAELVEENNKLRAEINTLAGELHGTQSKLNAADSALRVVENSLQSERKGFEIQLHKMENKLQETQDLLLIKIQELNAAQEANIPLRTEIDMLKSLIEEEEKRLALDGRFNARDTSGSGGDFITNLKLPTLASTNQNHVNSGSSLRQPPSSVPIATNGFARAENGSTGADLFRAPLSQSAFQYSANVPKSEKRPQSASTSSSSTFDETKEGSNCDDVARTGRESPGVRSLPPRPHTPTPPKRLPKRPLSAANARYISAEAGQGKDYFDAMFNDLRKDVMYTKVTEDLGGVDTSKVTSSLQQDLINSTARHDVKPSKDGRLWYSGSTASATGNLKIVEVDDEGRFVRVHNSSPTLCENIGGCLLQQNVAGHPVAVFRFPPRTKLQPCHTTTVWCSGSLEAIHDPPSHYVWKQLDKWGTGPECTTILCKPNGQAVAWMTSAPRISRVSRAYQYQPDVAAQTQEMQRLAQEMKDRQKDSQTQNHQGDGYGGEEKYGRVAASLPASYGVAPTLYTDSPTVPMPAPTLKREKSGSLPICTGGRLLPTRTGSAPLRRYNAPPNPVRHDSQTMAYQQRLATGDDSEIIDLTTQKSARSKYGFDFMTHPPKVINYDGTVRER